MSRTPNPATLELLQIGLQPKTLAEDLGISPQAVSFQLAGKSARTSTDLLDAIEERAGARVAGRVAALISQSRLARQQPTFEEIEQ